MSRKTVSEGKKNEQVNLPENPVIYCVFLLKRAQIKKRVAAPSNGTAAVEILTRCMRVFG